MIKECAVCGKPKHLAISSWVCSDCRKLYGDNASWVKALVQIERHNFYTNKFACNYEIVSLEDEFETELSE